MPKTKGSTYESLVDELVSGIRHKTTLEGYVQGSGPGNRIAGASGYRHQIDLSVLGPKDLFLFELKCWHLAVGVSEVLVLAARLNDIAAAYPSRTVHASMVSLRQPSRNVPPLARHFRVHIEVVTDLKSYGITFAKQAFVGHHEGLQVGSYMDAEVVRRDGG